MAINISCARCGKELGKPGALIFSPPDQYGVVDKYHICTTCWPSLMCWRRAGCGMRLQNRGRTRRRMV